MQIYSLLWGIWSFFVVARSTLEFYLFCEQFRQITLILISSRQWKKYARFAGHFDGHADALAQRGAHCPIEPNQGFTLSHWTLPLGKYTHRIAPNGRHGHQWWQHTKHKKHSCCFSHMFLCRFAYRTALYPWDQNWPVQIQKGALQIPDPSQIFSMSSSG